MGTRAGIAKEVVLYTIAQFSPSVHLANDLHKFIINHRRGEKIGSLTKSRVHQFAPHIA
jgi:hypothetical protein